MLASITGGIGLETGEGFGLLVKTPGTFWQVSTLSLWKRWAVGRGRPLYSKRVLSRFWSSIFVLSKPGKRINCPALIVFPNSGQNPTNLKGLILFLHVTGQADGCGN